MRPASKSMRWATGLGIFSILLLFGIGVSLLDVWRADRAKAWPATSGVIVQSRPQTCGRGSTGLRPDVRYKYQVEGKVYENWRIVFGSASCGSREAAKAITDRFPVAAVVKVSFDPQDPAEAVLIAGKVDESTWTGIYFMSFWFLLVAAATAMVVSVARSKTPS
jgi:hypothetical protein